MSDTNPTEGETRPIPGYPGYLVSRSGVIYSQRTGRPLMGAINEKGYRRVNLSSNGKYRVIRAHRAVLLAFIGPPKPGQIARHLNCVATDNRLENLAWGTHLENVQDGIRNGKHARGEGNGQAKLSESQVRAILHKHARGASACGLARQYGVGSPTIDKIVNGETWRHISRFDMPKAKP